MARQVPCRSADSQRHAGMVESDFTDLGRRESFSRQSSSALDECVSAAEARSQSSFDQLACACREVVTAEVKLAYYLRIAPVK